MTELSVPAQPATAFVIMPIRSAGSEEHAHFRALFDGFIKPRLSELGFAVTRADDIAAGGAITRDVILHLAHADLVVADLTDLNANVHYELGVRHTLRGHGTVMILDKTRTADIPFDLSAYRVIEFRSDVVGISELGERLAEFARPLLQQGFPEESLRDNPVHDWLPALPVNAIASAIGSEEGRLREQLAESQRRVRLYETRYGAESLAPDDAASPLSVVQTALRDARDGNVPHVLVSQAQDARGRDDQVEFLTIIRRVLEMPANRFSSQQYARLANGAAMFGLSHVARAIFKVATTAYPNDDDLEALVMESLAHSSDAGERAEGRVALLRRSGVTVDDAGNVSVPDLDELSIRSLAVALDAYQADRLTNEAVAITEAIRQRFPTRSIVLRLYARALEGVGKGDAAGTWYQRALWCPDANDVTAVWFGNYLHNGRRWVDALEAYLVACQRDLNDGSNFSHVADELSRALQHREGMANAGRELPQSIDSSALSAAVESAFSCPDLGQAAYSRCIDAAQRAELSRDAVASMIAIRVGEDGGVGSHVPVARSERARFVSELYEALKSPVTVPDERQWQESNGSADAAENTAGSSLD